MKPQLGQLMVDHGLITPDQLTHALAEQQRIGRPLGKLLVELGYVSEGAVANALAQQHGGLLKTEFGISAGFHGERLEAAVAAPPAPAPPPADDTRVAELQARVGELEGERTALHEHVREVRAIAERAIVAEQAASSRVRELEEALKTAQPRLAQLTQEVESLRAQLAAAETAEPDPSREDSLLASLANLERELAAARARAAELEEAERRRGEEVASLTAALESYRAQVDDEPEPEPERELAHLLYVPSADGYTFVEREGPPPASGSLIGLDGVDFRVTRVGRAPVRGGDLRCAFLLRV